MIGCVIIGVRSGAITDSEADKGAATGTDSEASMWADSAAVSGADTKADSEAVSGADNGISAVELVASTVPSVVWKQV